MVEYLKKARPQEEGVTQKVRDAVSEILLAVEKEGIAAVRRYSEQVAPAAAAIADGEFMLGHALTCRIRQERARERTGAR
jgi:hypothetical protein